MFKTTTALALCAAAAVLSAFGAIAPVQTAEAASTATGGAGASLPYQEVQAEAATTNGTVIGPSYTQGQLADEASGRKAVTLSGVGKYVQLTLPQAANSVDVRYSVPDTADGSVYSAPLGLSVGGTKQADLSLTNAYSWYYGGYPFSNQPSQGSPHHFYDEVHRLLDKTYPAGTTITLQVDAASAASSITVDLADFEAVAPASTQPSGSKSVTDYGADATGAKDSSAAFTQAIAAAGAGGTVWIPAGTFQVNQHVMVNNVTVAGAGIWRSTVTGNGVGFYGNSAPNPSTNVKLHDFAIVGNVQERNDSAQVNGVGGAMSNSTVSNLWIEHTKVGAWMDGPMDGTTFSGLRIRDTTADGINFHDGVTNSTVTNSDLRNLGDDGLATWADTNADANDTFSNNTVQLPILANGIAIYGGHDNTVSGNRVVDAGINQGGGIHVAQRFNSTPLGKTTVSGNTIVRSGDLDPNWQFGVGALWFDARDAAVNAQIAVSNLVIQDSPYEAVQFVSGSSIQGVSLSNVTIQNVGTFAVQKQVAGAATFTNVTATGIGGPAGTYDCGVGFTITDGGGNSGYGTQYCGPWPASNLGGSGGGGSNPAALALSPSSLSFGSTNVGSSSAAQTITVKNTGGATASISGVSASGDFAQTNTCGSSLPAGASCSVSVTFKPTAAGSRTGTLAVSGSASTSAALSGAGVATSGTNLALGKPASASSSTDVYGAGNVTDGNTSSYWESQNNAFPQWVQVDLGSAQSVSTVTLNLPPSSAWGARTETLSVQGSTDGSSFSTLKASAGYTFDPSTGNAVRISVPTTSVRYVRIAITGNTGWAAGQVSELGVFG
ncbi:discoidin domain-containing protein [Curtobacterium sp. ISL-83]|uniref:discoidin domain-containing protein n=1 Tax=Curtobacterium sp. ISL-83 TaxID=2819145 RepID=UPI001BEC58AA|nr:discoidin domain-containing protein [Curtobacterium sp. ISL-83]MBT2502401.1 discoidin domain-containing protein [Curtobacterium sp. ISL-83]